MKYYISHSFEEETIEVKARWFQSFTMRERLKYLCSFVDLILEINISIMEQKHARQPSESIQILTMPERNTSLQVHVLMNK